MMTPELQKWIDIFEVKAAELYPASDPSHDLLHIRRVVRMAKRLAESEKSDLTIGSPAAYFHDMANVPKNEPRRSQASRLSAEAAVEYLKSVAYPADDAKLAAIAHAVAAHSFSAAIKPETIEAKVVQDADRLDGLGAIGLARMFTVSGLLGRPYYDDVDPLGQAGRRFDDTVFSIDHFEVKLFRTAETMQTEAGRAEAAKRVAVMKAWRARLMEETGHAA